MNDMGNSEADATYDSSEGGTGDATRRRRIRTFPALSFKETLFLAEAIQTHGAGQPIRRLTLFESLQRSPGSDTSRKLITSSNQYGITEGSYSAEFLSLTQKGAVATDPVSPEDVKLLARFNLAIGSIPAFQGIYDKYRGSRLPGVEVLRDAAREAGSPDDHAAECVETFLANARELRIVRTIAGSEHLLPIDAALEQVALEPPGALSPALNAATATNEISDGSFPIAHAESAPKAPKSHGKFSGRSSMKKTCFVVSPIGSSDSVERKHADLVLSSLIIPALEELDLEVVRADRISKPGLITGQVIEHIAQAALVIADLSFANPNVYYELALRHAARKPVVQIIRTGDKLPFDVGQYRTVEIDMTDIYVLVPKLDLHRQEITRQARAAMADGGSTESPLSQFYPAFWEHIEHPPA